MSQKTTPMLQQYHAIKARHPDCILFFRLGDFYEMFFEDAKTVAQVLDLVLTSRHKGSPHETPMCGFPHHAAEGYIARLVKAGYRIAICEQTEDPAQAKGLVKRDVIRVITSGTYLDENNPAARYILCLHPNKKNIGLAFTDPSTGAILANEYPLNPRKVTEIILRLPVYECMFPESAQDKINSLFNQPVLKSRGITLSPYQNWCFNPDIARKSLQEHFHVHNLQGFGLESLPLAATSSAALLEYLKQMNQQPMTHMDKISLYADEDYLFISPAAHAGLELDPLIRTLDHTRTALGKRLFHFWITHPLKDKTAILARQDAIEQLKETSIVLEELKNHLAHIPDLEKHISRLSCGYTHARDLLAIRNTLSLVPALRQTMKKLPSASPLFHVPDITNLRERLAQTINEDIPLSKPEGKIIQKGFHAELDELRGLQENGRQWLKNFQERETKRTGINSLKVGFNKIFGYYIEISRTKLDAVPKEYIRKQTLVNAERFITQELKEYEEKILTAQDKIIKIENEIVKQLQAEILAASAALHELAQSLATVDGLHSLAVLANNPGYVKPVVTEDLLIDIQAGRHPVVEMIDRGSFVPNDTRLNPADQHCIILTGPNMSGKSTYIRQTAILVILAQTGSFIPAEKASIGLVDKVFTRIGAHDDIAKGQSTFMVEMNETADILNNMTERSLLILDEIGRGTSTYDGLSLAWALVEHLHKTKARTLFATHFHELTVMAEDLVGLTNYNVAVKEWKDEVVFLHKIVPGSTDDSYGLYVAKLAGIPAKVVNRAKQILSQLEYHHDLTENLRGPTSGENQMTLFSPQADPVKEKVVEEIQALNVDDLPPLKALNKIQEWKDLLE